MKIIIQIVAVILLGLFTLKIKGESLLWPVKCLAYLSIASELLCQVVKACACILCVVHKFKQ